LCGKCSALFYICTCIPTYIHIQIFFSVVPFFLQPFMHYRALTFTHTISHCLRTHTQINIQAAISSFLLAAQFKCISIASFHTIFAFAMYSLCVRECTQLVNYTYGFLNTIFVDFLLLFACIYVCMYMYICVCVIATFSCEHCSPFLLTLHC